MDGIVIVRTGGEIGIKSKPVKREYGDILLKSIKESLREHSIPFSRIWRDSGRIYVLTPVPKLVAELASRTFGISSVSPGLALPSNYDEIVKAGISYAMQALRPGTFAVRCRRVGEHPFTSQQIEAAVGKGALEKVKGLKVDLDSPEQEIGIEIRKDLAIVYAETIYGPDGFPTGTQDPFVGMIDETAESVIASWSIMKRGSPLVAVALGEINDQRMQSNLNALARWLPKKGYRCLLCPPPAIKLQKSELRTLHYLIALRYAMNNQIGAVVSGLSPRTLEDAKTLFSLAQQAGVCPFFPLIAAEKTTIESWASLIPISLDSAPRYGETAPPKVPINDAAIDEIIMSSKEIRISYCRPLGPSLTSVSGPPDRS